MKESWVFPITCLVLILIAACVVCLCLVAGLAFYSQQQANSGDAYSFTQDTGPTPVVIRPTAVSATQMPASEDNPPQGGPKSLIIPGEQDPLAVLKVLSETIIPENDLIKLSGRLQGKKNIQPTRPTPEDYYTVGDQKEFWVSNVDTNENFKTLTTLQYVTDHAYFWIEDGASFDKNDLARLAETFENKIYPTNREFFGSEWSPGSDGDPHIFILYVSNAGGSIAGYFSAVDSYPPEAHEYSNWHETFVFNIDNLSLDEEFTYGVLAHEFQHMIHWYGDRNEDTWLNEGFSDLAMLLNDYTIGGHDQYFAMDADLQLNDWPNDHSATTPHYGASFLFTTYFLDRLGEEVTKALVSHDENGLGSIDSLMEEMGLQDNVTNRPLRADDIFLDWTLANYLQDEDVGDGRFSYHNYPEAPRVSETESITTCDSSIFTRDVHQYGADYIRFECPVDITIQFEGSTQVGVLPTDAYSGQWYFWSNKGDESDMTLTRTFDFSEADGPLTLSYWTWYDLEKDYDYLYLLASTNGEDWEMIQTPSGSGSDITGNNFGWGYNDLSGGSGEAQWIEETIDISKYAGQEVQLRFEYVTDAAVNGEGFLVDDISVPEIDYFTDFEADQGGWEAAGFVRIQNVLPQDFRLALITIGKKTVVEYISLAADISAEIPIRFSGDVREAVLVVTGTTRFTRELAAYRFTIK